MSIVKFNVDEATYIGDEEDGCYYQIGQGPDDKYYVTVAVDLEGSGYCGALYTDEGPFGEEEKAQLWAEGACQDWCADNDVTPR